VPFWFTDPAKDGNAGQSDNPISREILPMSHAYLLDAAAGVWDPTNSLFPHHGG
jgi:hypothetical protein